MTINVWVARPENVCYITKLNFDLKFLALVITYRKTENWSHLIFEFKMYVNDN